MSYTVVNYVSCIWHANKTRIYFSKHKVLHYFYQFGINSFSLFFFLDRLIKVTSIFFFLLGGAVITCTKWIRFFNTSISTSILIINIHHMSWQRRLTLTKYPHGSSQLLAPFRFTWSCDEFWLMVVLCRSCFLSAVNWKPHHEIKRKNVLHRYLLTKRVANEQQSIRLWKMNLCYIKPLRFQNLFLTSASTNYTYPYKYW